jgi:formylglycine-generating enzyme required for sulfatase activity
MTGRSLDLGDGLSLELRRIPAGRFVMGDACGSADERPLRVVEVREPFWMGTFEVTNEQFARYDPNHDSRFEHRSSWIFDEAYLGWPLNAPRQPVVRVSWQEAMGFCDWLTARTGLRVTLPTEEQWEYACRAGTATALSYGGVEADFASHANLADASLRLLAIQGWRPKAPDLVARIDGVDDGALVTTQVGGYAPNAWGLHDLHGNAAEWTRSPDATDAGARVVRGGSWRDRPHRARSSFRLSYPAWQKVFNVGFRVVVEAPVPPDLAGAAVPE